jgi:hypothetical protein
LIVIVVSPTFDTAKVPNSPPRRKMKFCASAYFLGVFDLDQPEGGECCAKATSFEAHKTAQSPKNWMQSLRFVD